MSVFIKVKSYSFKMLCTGTKCGNKVFIWVGNQIIIIFHPVENLPSLPVMAHNCKSPCSDLDATKPITSHLHAPKTTHYAANTHSFREIWGVPRSILKSHHSNSADTIYTEGGMLPCM